MTRKRREKRGDGRWEGVTREKKGMMEEEKTSWRDE